MGFEKNTSAKKHNNGGKKKASLPDPTFYHLFVLAGRDTELLISLYLLITLVNGAPM